jgi:hypothetical protein
VDALPTLHSIVAYVTNFFGCTECVGHFAVLAARLETDVREMADVHHQHGGRARAALWLWQVHNKVNERLAAEALTDSPATKYAEFAKEQWPSRHVCPECREVAMPPRAGVRPELRWREAGVLKFLLEQYCLEPRFECWDTLARLGAKRIRPAAEVSATYGGIATGGAVILLFMIACGCCVCRGQSSSPCPGDATAPARGKYKRDHVV